MNMSTRACVTLLLCASASIAAADPITLSFTGSGSGTLGGVSFSSASFTITGYSNTNALQSCGSLCGFYDQSATTIDIAGVGVVDFMSSMRTFANGGVVGFSRGGSGGSDLFDSSSIAQVSTWDRISSLGPVTGTGTLLQWDLAAVMTSLGVLHFDTGLSPLTFTASVDHSQVDNSEDLPPPPPPDDDDDWVWVDPPQEEEPVSVPEPSGLALFAAALLGLMLVRRGRRSGQAA